MSGGSRIIDLRPGPEASTDCDGVVMRGGDSRPTMSDAVAEALPPDPPGLAGSDDDPLLVLDLAPEQSVIMTEDAARSGRAWLFPVFGAAVSAGWIAVMVWLAAPELRDASAIALSGFVAALCTPPALIGILLLLRLRTGAAEARRFASSAMAMREEAARLELALLSMTRSLEISRGRITDQGIALEAIGERSIARLDGIGSGMAQQVGSARDHAATLAAAADAAQARLAELVDRLPRAHADTQQLAGLLDQAADRTSERVAGFAAQLGGLADAARQADTAAGDAARQLGAHIERMEATSAAAGARLEQITGSMATQIDAMLGQTALALDEARKGIAAQGDAMLAMLGTNQAALDHAGRDSAEMLADRVTAIEASVGRIGDRLLAQRDAGDAMVRDLDTGIGRVSGRLDALHAQGVDRTQSLAASISALGGSADAMTEALKVGEAMAGGAIVSTEHLLTALDAAAREIDETLPDALGRLDARITDSRRVVSAAKPELLALVTAAESTHDAIEAIAQVIGAQREAVDKMAATLLDALNAGKLKADALGQMVDETVGRTHRFAEEAAPRLVEAMLRVRDSATAAAERARETLGNVIPEAARAIEVASAEAMRHGAFTAFEQQLGAIGEAATAAAEAASDASERLTRQMLAITDSTAMVESKIEAARAEHENADRDSFARRVSLLIETLNSASIDIAKSFSTDVSDSAWAAYLKGDRGVFTRRAVRLLDTADSREIVRLYDQERPFREQVNRYIHDFEAMLRAVLAQRDGSSLGVTILSSDMGKLYVALAQAIERLRT